MYPLINTISILYKLKFKKNITHKELLNILETTIGLNDTYKQKVLVNKFIVNQPKININNSVIDFLTIVRNGEFYYTNIFPKIYKDLCYNLNVRFFIYENNSTDNTKKILRELADKHHNIFIKMEVINDLPDTRVEKIIIGRNNLSKFYKQFLIENDIGGDFVFLFDTDILFNYKESIKPLLEKINYQKSLMILSNTIFAGNNPTLNLILDKKNKYIEDEIYINSMLNFYYDSFALNYGELFRKDLTKFIDKDMKHVFTAFGGLGIIRKDYYLTSFFDYKNFKRTFTNKFLGNDMICEHWGFCDRMNKFGNIFINKKSEALWYQDKDFKNGKFFNYVKFFIKEKNLDNIFY